MSRDKLQETLNEMASNDNKIDGGVILNPDSTIFMKSKTQGFGGVSVDSDAFIRIIGRNIRDCFKRAPGLSAGKASFLALVMEKALCTVFAIDIAERQLILAFFVSDPSPDEALGEHLANCRFYKREIEGLLKQIVR